MPHRCTWNCLPKAPLMKTWLKLWSPGGRPSSFFLYNRRGARWGIGSQFRSIRKRENGSESRPHCSMERSRVIDAREFRCAFGWLAHSRNSILRLFAEASSLERNRPLDGRHQRKVGLILQVNGRLSVRWNDNGRQRTESSQETVLH